MLSWNVATKVVLLGAPVAITGVAFGWLVYPLGREIAEIDERIAEAKYVLAAESVASRELESYQKAERDKLAMLLQHEQLALPGEETDQDRFAYLRLLEERAQVQIQVCRQDERMAYAFPRARPSAFSGGEEGVDEAQLADYDGVRIQLVVDGRFSRLLEFLELVERGPRVFAMESLEMKRGEARSNRLRLRMVAVLARSATSADREERGG